LVIAPPAPGSTGKPLVQVSLLSLLTPPTSAVKDSNAAAVAPDLTTTASAWRFSRTSGTGSYGGEAAIL